MYDKCYFCLDQLPKLKKESTASFFVNFGGAGVQKSRPTLLYYPTTTQPQYPPSPSGSALKQEDAPQAGPVGLRGKLHGTEHMLMVTTIMMAMMTVMKMTTMLVTTKEDDGQSTMTTKNKMTLMAIMSLKQNMFLILMLIM